jgi:hypothetical protein
MDDIDDEVVRAISDLSYDARFTGEMWLVMGLTFRHSAKH